MISKRALSFGLSVALIAAFLLTVQVKAAHAYIDLGTGSFLLQMALATVFASLFMVKVYWRRFTGQVSRFFMRLKASKVKVD